MIVPVPPNWIRAFPHFEGMSTDHLTMLVRGARRIQLSVEAQAFQPGEPCTHYILVEEGSIRVSLIDSEGHEIVLYRLSRGESCVLTTATLLAHASYEAVAVAETPVEAILIPREVFFTLLGESTVFRSRVLADHGNRVLGLMSNVGRLAFETIDSRLTEALHRLAASDGQIVATHETIAVEIGTAREVVSRRLKHYEQMGWVTLHRGRIQILKAMPLGRP